MTISVRCQTPGCEGRFRLKDELAGKRISCPNCGQVLRVAAPAAGSQTIPPTDLTSASQPTARGARTANRQPAWFTASWLSGVAVGAVASALLVGSLMFVLLNWKREPGATPPTALDTQSSDEPKQARENDVTRAEPTDQIGSDQPKQAGEINITVGEMTVDTTSPLVAPKEDLALNVGPAVKMEFVWIAEIECWVGKYELTNEEYRQYVEEHDSGSYKDVSLNSDRQPVVEVSFHDVAMFAKWLAGKAQAAGQLPSGFTVRLPTDEEWTTFASCGGGREYCWGNAWPPRYGNYETHRYLDQWEGYSDGFIASCPVERSGRNDWGLYGVGGNVYEWVGAMEVGPGLVERNIRGGSWSTPVVDATFSCEFKWDVPTSSESSSWGARLLVAPTR